MPVTNSPTVFRLLKLANERGIDMKRHRYLYSIPFGMKLNYLRIINWRFIIMNKTELIAAVAEQSGLQRRMQKRQFLQQ